MAEPEITEPEITDPEEVEVEAEPTGWDWTKRYVVTESFTARYHSQQVSFAAGAELDANVGEYFVERGAPIRVEDVVESDD
jgi:hypothetical protein